MPKRKYSLLEAVDVIQAESDGEEIIANDDSGDEDFIPKESEVAQAMLFDSDPEGKLTQKNVLIIFTYFVKLIIWNIQ